MEGQATRLRADARRNQEQVLQAARDLFVERGIDCPLEEIARRAGVGIGTLYRRFGDRDALVRAVLVDALELSAPRRRRRSRRGVTVSTALARYLREMLDVRVSAVIPLALDRMRDPAFDEPREASAHAVERLVEAAHDDGSLSPAVSFGDVGTLLVRLSRPLPGPVDAELDNRLAHRHLDLVLAGMRAADAVLESEGPSRAGAARRRLLTTPTAFGVGMRHAR